MRKNLNKSETLKTIKLKRSEEIALKSKSAVFKEGFKYILLKSINDDTSLDINPYKKGAKKNSWDAGFAFGAKFFENYNNIIYDTQNKLEDSLTHCFPTQETMVISTAISKIDDAAIRNKYSQKLRRYKEKSRELEQAINKLIDNVSEKLNKERYNW